MDSVFTSVMDLCRDLNSTVCVDTDFVALIHFNMGTFAHNGDPCCDPSNWAVKAPYATGMTKDPATFNPKLLNTTQW